MSLLNFLAKGKLLRELVRLWAERGARTVPALPPSPEGADRNWYWLQEKKKNISSAQFGLEKPDKK